MDDYRQFQQDWQAAKVEAVLASTEGLSLARLCRWSGELLANGF
ncbi:hypothetical protein O9929_15485 [Vibrio lentus]|nr:hypothetical protein [Vibrio lentus]